MNNNNEVIGATTYQPTNRFEHPVTVTTNTQLTPAHLDEANDRKLAFYLIRAERAVTRLSKQLNTAYITSDDYTEQVLVRDLPEQSDHSRKLQAELDAWVLERQAIHEAITARDTADDIYELTIARC